MSQQNIPFFLNDFVYKQYSKIVSIWERQSPPCTAIRFQCVIEIEWEKLHIDEKWF